MKLICPICGMEINVNNYNFNDVTFEDKNSQNNIMHCPFCGVESKYLIVSNNFNRLDIMKLGSETIRIIDHAVKLEVFNGDFYKAAYEKAKDSYIKDLFQSLSRIEYMHAKIHQKLGGFERLPQLTKLDYSRLNTDELLLKEASTREKHAVQYYESNYYKLESDEIKIVFKALCEVEKGHILITSK